MKPEAIAGVPYNHSLRSGVYQVISITNNLMDDNNAITVFQHFYHFCQLPLLELCNDMNNLHDDQSAQNSL